MAVRGSLLAAHPGLDWVFIFGPLVLALGLGLLASMSSAMLMSIVLVDVWLFANPHLVATYTRLGACAADARRHWFLIFFLPMLVLAGVIATALAYEVAGLFTLYFIAQTYHVARQSFGIARACKRAELGPFRRDRLAEGLVYLFPVWGLLDRCAAAPQTFLDYPIQLPPVSAQVADTMGVVALACGGYWLLRQCRAALAGKIKWRHDAFVASHLCVSLAAYIWIADITAGWLAVNIWHNLQYLLFVWAQNIRRDGQAEDGPTTRGDCAGLWKNAARYCSVCLLLGAAFYQAADWAGTQFLWLGLPTVLIAHFTLNFHHYLVDGVIWKRRRPWQARWLAFGRLRETASDCSGEVRTSA